MITCIQSQVIANWTSSYQTYQIQYDLLLSCESALNGNQLEKINKQDLKLRNLWPNLTTKGCNYKGDKNFFQNSKTITHQLLLIVVQEAREKI